MRYFLPVAAGGPRRPRRVVILARLLMSALERPVVKPRPVYLDLVRIRLPLPGIVSILHRVSGAALFLFGIPLLLFAVQCSLASPEQFASLKAVLTHPLGKLVTLGFVWAYLHHFCAGIRYLMIDLHVGDDLAPARRSSAWVLAVSLALTLVAGWRLW
jgi:succinate dehydrogenase / fumarate reductase cytochrome b subunit